MIFRTLIILVLFVTLGCSQNLKIMWDPSETADLEGLTHYTVYKWEGTATQAANWDISQMDSIGILPHVLNYSGPYEFHTFFAEDKIIRAGCTAFDSLSRSSSMALSRFYDKPSEMEEVWIEK